MKVGTEQEWQAARNELLAAERELEEHDKRVEEQRGELPWVPVEKDYSFATETWPKPLPGLFEGRSQLLIYHLIFGEDWAVACPGCSSLADGLGGVVEHLNDRDVTLLCMSHAPLEKLVSYKRRRGWTVPYVSAHVDGAVPQRPLDRSPCACGDFVVSRIARKPRRARPSAADA